MKRSRQALSESPPAQQSRARPSAEAVDRKDTYLCPACGRLVDSRDRDAMALHHRHVLFPRQFDLGRKGAWNRPPTSR